MFCPECGERLNDDAKFCPNCGASLKPKEGPLAAQPKQQEQSASEPKPEPEPVPEPPAKPADKGPAEHKKKLIIGMVIVAALLLVGIGVAVGTLLSAGGSQASTEPTPTETSGPTSIDEPEPQTEDSFEDAFVGEWVMKGSSITGLSEDDIIAFAQEGRYLTLSMRAGGTAHLVSLYDEYDATWTATSATEGSFQAEGADAVLSMELKDGVLNLYDKEASDSYMHYVPEGTLEIPEPEPGPEPEPTSGKTVRMGNDEVGHIEVPDTWVDRTSDDFSDDQVKQYHMSFFVDPGSEYTSAALGHYSFGKAIRLATQEGHYQDVALDIQDMYEEQSDMFDESSIAEIQFSGHNAVLLTTTLKEDGLQLCSIVIDRDDDYKNAIVIDMNCGASEETAREVLEYASTWTRE